MSDSINLPNTSKTPKKEKKNKGKSGSKMNAKTKNTLIFGILAVILIIITFIMATVMADSSKVTYVSSYGDIKTSVVLNTKKMEAVLSIELEGQTVTQNGTYKSLDEPTFDSIDVSDDESTSTEQHFELYIGSEDVETITMNIIDDELSLLYDDGTTVIYHKE